MVKGFLKEDILIINSDCLTNLVPQEEIFKQAKKDIEQAPKELVKIANENIIKFRDYLNSKGITATIRRELGSDIDAACGQLRRKNL